ncbi:MULTISPECIES: DUF3122 domain-containing protein [unclassified Nostoc]|uniref:DUF3122 domain-containing protein n=1 Tax=unclassified Nostoc TaxID=2593658 RepID=UPI002AD522B9|nr:DUF3122 domain-containing protein [Nostoc sp. DedQUE03]MDZ7977351.1 DUF3122 domain-containing protein [Nostoc sp. DedQUE03]MDZ8043405.1 DUF3122 domain-containing protein [Nostoc sp. DedQUE02]
MYRFTQYIWRCALVVFLALTLYGWGVEEAHALLRQHHDSPGVLHYHSQVSIKDNKGYAWQVLLFKQNYNSPVKDLRLRLVGFPGVVEVAHPQPLEIEATSGKLLLVSDVYALTAPAPNVGEYELTDVLAKLPTTDALKLHVPAYSEQPLVLNIPNTVVTEWQWLVTEID